MESSRISIQRELSFIEVISKTFELFAQNFLKYVLFFLVMYAIVGALNALVSYYVVIPNMAPNATFQQVSEWLPGFIAATFIYALLSVLVMAIFGAIAFGAAIKMTSDAIESKQPDLMTGVRFALSKLLSIWVLALIVGIVVFIGLIALIVPGIILAIMLSLALPALLIERLGVFDSLERSRRLVRNRWLKTLAVFIVIGLIVAIVSGIVSSITSHIGITPVQIFLDGIISAFYAPIIPIVLTVYYYSNAARIAPRPAPQSGMHFCPSCGGPVTSENQAFCIKCGKDLRSPPSPPI